MSHSRGILRRAGSIVAKTMKHPRSLIALSVGLLLLGVLLPFFMVIRILEPSFALSFFAHAASVVGLVVGLLGVSPQMRDRV